MMYSSWDTEWNRLIFFVILGHILPFEPPNNLENQNFEKMKKVHGHSIILQMCTINDNHIMYGSWDMERDRQNFGPFFALLLPLTTQKIKFWKNEKMPRDIILHMCTINDEHMMHSFWDMEYEDRQNFLSFWAIFAFWKIKTTYVKCHISGTVT